jgi:glucokinase
MTNKSGEKAYALGVDLGGNNLRWGLVSQVGKIIKRDSVRSKGYKSKKKAIEHILNTIKNAVNKYKKEGYEIKGVGVGIPGLIIKEKGYIHKSPNFKELNGVNMQKLLEEKLSLKVLIENDVNAWAWGEHAFGVAKRYKNFMVMTLGTGVGGGIVVDGNLIDGRDGTAGEIGHLTIYPDGIKCKCGNHGCLEKYASATGVIDNLKLHTGEEDATRLIKNVKKNINKITAYDVYKEAKKGNKLALNLFKNVGIALGIAIAGLVNLLNLDAIIIGGGVSEAWDIFVPELKKEMRKRAFLIPAKRCKIIKTKLGDNGGILGMARMIFDEG